MKGKLGALARLRVDKGLTLRDVGNLVGTSQETIRQWEVGTTVPDTIRAQRYAEVLEITQAQLNEHLSKAKAAREEQQVAKAAAGGDR